MSNKLKIFYRVSFGIMLYCLFSLTIGHLLPIYFEDDSLRGNYYFYIYILFLITVVIQCFRKYYIPEKKNGIYIAISSIVVGVGIFLITFLFVIRSSVAVWTDATTLYVKKDDPKVRIVTRYINEGAFGGGTEPGDYEVVILRPVTSLLKLETAIDTNKINKQDWVKSH